MDSVLDLFLGDPVYDENGKLIKRDFGVKNILAIAVVVFVGYSLMGKSFSVPTLSGKKKGKKMKGGLKKWKNITKGEKNLIAIISFFAVILLIIFGSLCAFHEGPSKQLFCVMAIGFPCFLICVVLPLFWETADKLDKLFPSSSES